MTGLRSLSFMVGARFHFLFFALRQRITTEKASANAMPTVFVIMGAFFAPAAPATGYLFGALLVERDPGSFGGGFGEAIAALHARAQRGADQHAEDGSFVQFPVIAIHDLFEDLIVRTVQITPDQPFLCLCHEFNVCSASHVCLFS